jgi:DMSO/TMAO reductase YedYZ molybdopterin-dependent catalytic subunit
MLLAEDLSKRNVLVRSKRPEDLEMELLGFSSYITPIEDFFVRTHVYVPSVNPNTWRLKVDGEVAAPLALAMEDLKKFSSVELVAVLECAGNGRRFYEPTVPGIQWGTGAVGNGRWRGVRLADVLKRAGVKASAKQILFDGADVPLGAMPDFQRSIPLKKALDPNTLLAYEMNGETLPEKHGFPLRVVAPGWAGDSWVKWVTSIRVLDRESDGFWMKSAYRHPGKAVAPGSAVALDKMQPVTSLRVKTVIASPVDGFGITAGTRVTIRGVAWSGDQGPVTAVDVSVDGGRTWQAARLGKDRSQFGWRQWDLAWTPEEGYFTIMARARDAGGDTQPSVQEWNPSGYLWNVVPRVNFRVLPSGVSTDNASGSVSPPALVQPAGFRTACLVCHDDDVISQQQLTRDQWDREISKMTGWGAPVKPEDREGILQFLSANYRPRR